MRVPVPVSDVGVLRENGPQENDNETTILVLTRSSGHQLATTSGKTPPPEIKETEDTLTMLKLPVNERNSPRPSSQMGLRRIQRRTCIAFGAADVELYMGGWNKEEPLRTPVLLSLGCWWARHCTASIQPWLQVLNCSHLLMSRRIYKIRADLNRIFQQQQRSA